MRFLFVIALFILCLVTGHSGAYATPNYTSLQKQIHALSQSIRNSEDRNAALDVALNDLEKQRDILAQDIMHNRYHSTISLHHILSETFYPPILAFFKKDQSVYTHYYAYRTNSALHEYYQNILNAQILRKIELDEKSDLIRQYSHEREMITLSLNDSMSRLKSLQQNQSPITDEKIAEFQKTVDGLRQRHNDLNAFIASVTGTKWAPDINTMAEDKGFTLPVSGTITIGFNDYTAIGGKSSGLTVKARSGAAVSAPLSGHILYAGEFNRLGHVIIIQHRNNLMSIVKGLGEVYVMTGDLISQNQIIGILPQENPQELYNGAMLYYELRYNELPVNPLDQLSG